MQWPIFRNRTAITKLTVNAQKIKNLIAEELASVSDSRVRKHIESLLIEPVATLRHWDYGEPDTRYECWNVLEGAGGLGIAYSQYGFGPKCPWGLVRVSGSESELSMGMDSSWCPRFMDAYFESAASELPIWRVFKQADNEPFPGTPISDELDWDSSWRELERLRQSDTSSRYHLHHTIGYSRTE